MISAEADTAVESSPMEARYWFCEGCGEENPPILSSDALWLCDSCSTEIERHALHWEIAKEG
jgi:hypothetical protein